MTASKIVFRMGVMLPALAAVSLLLTAMPQAAHAQELLVNEKSLCTFSNDGLVRISASGDVIIDDAACEISGDPELAVSPVLIEPASVDAGGSVTVLWTTLSAVSCDPVGELPDWTSSNLQTQGPATLTIPDSTAGATYQIGVSCSDGDGATDTVYSEPALTVNSDDTGGDPPPKPTLTVNGSSSTTVNPGGSVSIKWTSSDADECLSSGTLPGWSNKTRPTSGSETVDISADQSTGIFTVTLQCSNANGDSESAQASVKVSESDSGSTECSDRQPPPGMVRASDVNWSGSGGYFYADLFGPFPGGDKSSLEFAVDKGEYAAIEFTTKQINQNYVNEPRVTIAVEGTQFGDGTVGTDGDLLFSVSTCPGDFNKKLIESDPKLGKGCFARDRMGGGSESKEDPFRCGLDSNTTYYLNIVPVKPSYLEPIPETSEEVEWYCGDAITCGARLKPSRSGDPWYVD